MIRIGVDVGGTNTDAVVMQQADFLGGAKRPTSPDILSGVEAAIGAALGQANTAPAAVDAVMVGTTHLSMLWSSGAIWRGSVWCGCACRQAVHSTRLPTGPLIWWPPSAGASG